MKLTTFLGQLIFHSFLPCQNQTDEEKMNKMLSELKTWLL